MSSPAPSLRLRSLIYFGPDKSPARLAFGAGLNVLYGASDTGKSFVVATIDYMLGGKPPLEWFEERAGYDTVLLGVEMADGDAFSLVRSIDGGSFRLYEGLLEELPGADIVFKDLADQHNEKNDANLSMFLLGRLNLANRRVRRNARDETNSLSFRNLARLVVVNEDEIMQRRSPLKDGNSVADTPNLATFKLLLTGVDDSALSATAPAGPEDQSRDAQIELLDKLLSDYKDRLKEIAKHPDELTDQLERLENSMRLHEGQLRQTETEFQDSATRRRELRKRHEEQRDRRNEVGSLLERFALLDRHYVSDIERLKAIEEGGTLFAVLGSSTCPLCGADPEHQHSNQECEGNVDEVVRVARLEMAKIDVLRADLSTTVRDLSRESASFDRRLPLLQQQLKDLSEQVDGMVSPRLAQLRTSYAELAERRGQVKEAISLFATVQDMEKRRAVLDNGLDDQREGGLIDTDMAPIVVENFALTVEKILRNWHFPNIGRVFFDSKTRDLVIGGKRRTATGKGLRAITQAAFTLGLLEYCKSSNTPHPGFVVLDSPLLAYREPEGPEDDLSGTDLKDRFYEYLKNLPMDRQVLVIENSDPPDELRSFSQALMFSKNPHSGRYGLFPMPNPPESEALLPST